MIYYDLDGVLRELGYYVLGKETDNWGEKVNGKTFYEIVEEDKTILYKVPGTQYLPIVLSLCPEINIISSQLSGGWHEYTDRWIDERIRPHKKCNVKYVSKPSEKLPLLKDGDILVEDYPFFDDYSKIVLIDHLYNRELINAKNNPIIRVTNTDELKSFLEVCY